MKERASIGGGTVMRKTHDHADAFRGIGDTAPAGTYRVRQGAEAKARSIDHPYSLRILWPNPRLPARHRRCARLLARRLRRPAHAQRPRRRGRDLAIPPLGRMRFRDVGARAEPGRCTAARSRHPTAARETASPCRRALGKRVDRSARTDAIANTPFVPRG